MAGTNYPNSAPELNNGALSVIRNPAEIHALRKGKFVLRLRKVERKDFHGAHYGQQIPTGTPGMEFSGPSAELKVENETASAHQGYCFSCRSHTLPESCR